MRFQAALFISFLPALLLPRNLSPNVAVVLLLLGVCGIYAEFLLPGTVLPGVAGSLLALFGVWSLRPYPLQWRSAAWVLAAVLLTLAQASSFTAARRKARAVLACAAAVCLAAGEMTLIGPNAARAGIHPGLALATATPFALITSFLFSMAIRARRNKLIAMRHATLS